MKRVFSHAVAALTAGLCLRLFFALKFPFAPGDTPLYEQLATNWLQHHMYAMPVDGVPVPVDLRMPGYPAFLALIYAITGRIGPDARLYVTLVQAVVDLGTCLLTASLAALLGLRTLGQHGVSQSRRCREMTMRKYQKIGGNPHEASWEICESVAKLSRRCCEGVAEMLWKCCEKWECCEGLGVP